MNHWPFITAAYAIVLLGTGGLAALSFAAMRKAEAAAEALRSGRE
ncbi:heme exporter protein CcmD [Sphingomonas sp. R-74633]|nr:heme exporter protein CcmD [Sphingomonas sp. R-74633]NYT39460.1 heme exporter protein CcmD [Sphingomonas sp. R-74633]